MENLYLEIPDESHEEAYTEMISRWEKLETNINPSLLGRYSGNKKRNLTYAEWLACCEDDRTTGSMLSSGVPCTLYFLMNGSGDILGGIEINHANTHRGHLHAGMAPWNRGKGCGKIMLKLALEKCREMGFDKAEIYTHKGNIGAIKTITANGGVLTEEFFENDIWNNRYSIEL